MTKHTEDKKLKNFLKDLDEDIVVTDGLSHAFIGLTQKPEGSVAVYSTERIINHLMEEDLMTFEEADEFMHFRIIGSNVGSRTPIYIDVIPREFWTDEDTDKS